MDHPLEPGQRNKPHNLSEPQFPLPGSGKWEEEQYIPDHAGLDEMGYVRKAAQDGQHDGGDSDCKDGDDQVPSLLAGWPQCVEERREFPRPSVWVGVASATATAWLAS